MSLLSGKVAVVTGASKGIGAGIAKALAAEGANVVVNYSTSMEGAARVVADIQAKGGKAVAVQGNVSQAADVKRLFAETKKVFGTLDIVVNNAAVFKFEPLEAIVEEEFHRQFNTNVLGIILAVREAIPYFSARGGSVINISSVSSQAGMAGSTVYAGTKGAVDAIVRAMASELGPKNIRVNSIAPGGVETEGFISQGFKEMDFTKQMIAATPLGRLGQPDDIAQAAVFLASDLSRWVTGERLQASGGYR